MNSRSALIVALVAASLAIGLVAADLAFDTTIQVEALRDGEWVHATGHAPRLEPFFGGCFAQEFRVAIDHDGPFADNFHVFVSYHDQASKRQEVLVDQTVEVSAGTTAHVAFTVPDGAFTYDGTQNTATVQVNVEVAGNYYGVCSERERTD